MDNAKLEQALQTLHEEPMFSQQPKPSAELLARTIVRAKAITAGREAEKQLHDGSSTLTAEDGMRLAAESVVGRLMLQTEPPNGVSHEAMVGQLLQQPDFCRQVQRPAKELLSDLQSGRLVQSITRAPAQREGRQPEQPKRTVTPNMR